MKMSTTGDFFIQCADGTDPSTLPDSEEIRAIGLQIACVMGHVYLVRRIAKTIIGITGKLDELLTLCRNHLEVSECILDLMQDNYKHDHMRLAVKEGNLDFLKLLYRRDARYVDDAMIISASMGHLHIVKYIIEERIPSVEYIHVAFKRACTGKHMHVVRFFLDRGIGSIADAFHYACMYGDDELVDALLLKVDKHTRMMGLYGACKNGHLAVVGQLIGTCQPDIKNCFRLSCEGDNVKTVLYFIGHDNMSIFYKLNLNDCEVLTPKTIYKLAVILTPERLNLVCKKSRKLRRRFNSAKSLYDKLVNHLSLPEDVFRVVCTDYL